MANYFLKTIDAKTVTLDFPSTLARKSSDIVVTFPGVVVDDFVTIDAKFPKDASFSAWVSAIDKITVRFNNYTNSTINLSPFNLRILILKKELNSTGSSGTSGTSGVSGSSGTSGVGSPGSSGSSGTSGAGSPGGDGTSGTSGTSGSPGKKGTSGTSGISSSNEIGIKTIYTSKILDLTDNFKLINVSGAAIITIPSDLNVNFPIGSVIYVNQYGIEEVSFVTQQGVTLNSERNSKKLNGQFAQAFLIKISANVWQLVGNIKN